MLDISVKLDGDGVSVYGKDRTYADLRWDAVEPDFVAAWAAEDRANTALAHAARHAKKNEFEERLKPIRVAYINMAAPQRAQLIAQVVRYISGGG